MKMKTTLFLLLATSLTQAASIDWSGTYRFEYLDITKPAMGNPNQNKSYGMHFLTLNPRILASDGISVYSRFDLLTNNSSDYANSQLGQLWGGSGYETGVNTGNAGENNVTRDNQLKSDLKVRELYVKVEEDNGVLTLGRAPYQFGLGISNNAGSGLFDHWYDTKDMVAYKFYVGNLSFMPMLARSYDNSTAVGQMNQEQLLEIMYDNKDAGATIGILFERKNASQGVVNNPENDSWRDSFCGGVANCGTYTGAFKYERTSFFLARKWETFGFQLEGGFQKADTGVSVGGTQVEIDSYGIAAELKYKRPDSKWGYGLNFGVASGDNPGSTKFEGYQFDRNYDVAMLLFNHRLGQRDFLKTNVMKNGTRTVANSFDDEAISNATYVNLKLDHDWKERWKWNYSLTYAQLMDKYQTPSDMKKDLGVELDVSLVYFPREKVQWVNQVGVLMPGEAFKDGSTGLKNDTVVGFTSKAAISF